MSPTNQMICQLEQLIYFRQKLWQRSRISSTCEYPEGIIGDRVMYFQHKDINKVIFEGYKDEENELVVQAINDIYTDNKIDFFT